MGITLFSFLTSLIWVSIFAIVIKILSRQMILLRTFSIYPLFFLICLCLIRFFLPTELFYTQIIRSKNLLPSLQYVLTYPLIPVKGITINVLAILILVSGGIALYKFYTKISEYRRLNNILSIFPACKDQRVKSTLEKIQNLTGIRKDIKIVVDKSIRTPAIVGFQSQVIILPDINFTDDELFGILLHELQHYHQRHVIIKSICDIIQTIFWWNPFFRYFNTEVEHTLEMHSDEKVSYYLNRQQQRCYLNAIIKVIQNQEKNQKKSILTCCLVEEAKSDRLEQRFKMLLESNYSKIKKQRSEMLIPITFFLLMLSYSFVIQPYSEPSIQNYGNMTEISSENYFVKTDSGYDLYNEQGEIIATISVIDDSLKHLKIINEGVNHEKVFHN
ncbi:M56 family metallopeptidase [Lacrimispora sp. AGF001]|uniref:M56 family metallopeptidase n=1 Tax=Lacrimispora sp. AGF001 TaxID=3401631 RepID=UPI003B42FA7E|nr:M56 family metallopeptidase [Paenibacillaceae bacterium]